MDVELNVPGHASARELESGYYLQFPVISGLHTGNSCPDVPRYADFGVGLIALVPGELADHVYPAGALNAPAEQQIGGNP